jgi:FixJ family two-component response regulator
MSRGPLVVVVEDDPESRRTLARLLLVGGFDTMLYGSAEEYLSAPPASPPVCMLLDVNLGGMSGLDLQQRLRSSGSRIPVIVISAYDDLPNRVRAERLGCLAFLSKPCEAEAILALLRPLVPDRPAGS